MSRYLSQAELDAAAARNTTVIPLVEVLFAGGPLRLALGGHSVTSAGVMWYATQLIQIESATETADSTEAISFTLNGLDVGIVAIAAAEPYYRKPVRLYEQWLTDNYAAIAAPRLEWCGVLTRLVLTEQDRMVSVQSTAESLDADLAVVRSARYNKADQRRRYAADTGFDLVEKMTDATLIWPSKKALEK